MVRHCEERSDEAISTLAPQLRLKPFSVAQRLSFESVYAAGCVAREIRDHAVDVKLRESHIARLNNEERLKGKVLIHSKIEPGELPSKIKYALATFEFIEKDKKIPLQVLLIKDYDKLKEEDYKELEKFKINTPKDREYLSSPGLEGIWFINPTVPQPPAFAINGYATRCFGGCSAFARLRSERHRPGCRRDCFGKNGTVPFGDSPIFPRNDEVKAEKSLAKKIHDENIELTPGIEKNKILCHIITDWILPNGFQLLNPLEIEMRDEKYQEKIACLPFVKGQDSGNTETI